ncbi:MAG: alpha/beta fold hydrolase [Geodermatophilaceae bacterium]
MQREGDVPWPITAHHGIFKNTDLHVDDTGGSGRPVVLIHGWPPLLEELDLTDVTLVGSRWVAATDFFSANGEPKVGEQKRQEALTLCKQADKKASLACMTAFANRDFRDDLAKVNVSTLVMQGYSDFIVFYEGSGKRTHAAIAGSELHVIVGAPHGCNISNAEERNSALLDFLRK